MPSSPEPLYMNSIGDSSPQCARPLTNLVTPRVALPTNACDSHLHILGPAARYPYNPDRIYTPPDCLLAEYLTLRNSLGLTRCVLVQPSVYGSDNSALLEALRSLGNAGRGVVVLSGKESIGELRDMDAVGVKGVRVNLVDVRSPSANLPIEALLWLQERISPLGWHLELLVHVDKYPKLGEELSSLEVPIVFGHMGYLLAGRQSRSSGNDSHAGASSVRPRLGQGSRLLSYRSRRATLRYSRRNCAQACESLYGSTGLGKRLASRHG